MQVQASMHTTCTCKLHACAHVSDLIQEKPPLVAAVIMYVPQAQAPLVTIHPAAVGGEAKILASWAISQGIGLNLHYHWSPACRPTEKPASSAPAGKKPRLSCGARTLFNNRVYTMIANEMLRGHEGFHMSYPQLDAVMNIILACVDLAVEFLEGEIPVGSSAFEHVTQAFHQLPSAQTLVEERSKSISQARNAILRSIR